ncbi:hypothetical protein, partial [Gemmatimonas sp.]|uniref:hypothetical protein n=1 Tax=Gemmatimonas sp. TaxID=1962908 RepID=UPI00333E63B2
PTVTAVPTALEAHEGVGGHAAARQSVLARSVIASYTRPTPIEIPILLPERIRRKILFDNTNRLYQLGL